MHANNSSAELETKLECNYRFPFTECAQNPISGKASSSGECANLLLVPRSEDEAVGKAVECYSLARY